MLEMWIKEKRGAWCYVLLEECDKGQHATILHLQLVFLAKAEGTSSGVTSASMNKNDRLCFWVATRHTQPLNKATIDL